jgi:hypothetical protein
MIVRGTNNKALAVIVFMFTTWIMVASYILTPASALNSNGVCKDNNKDKNLACVHTTSGASKLHNKNINTKQNHNSKQSNSDQQNNVPFELPFP